MSKGPRRPPRSSPRTARNDRPAAAREDRPAHRAAREDRSAPIRENDAARAPWSGEGRAARTAPELLWLHGRHAVRAAVANPTRRITRLLALATTAAELEAARAGAPVARPPVEIVPRADLERWIGEGRDEAAHQGFAALVKPLPDITLPELLADLGRDRPAVLAVLDQVTDPRNVGALLRSAAAFAVTAVIVQDRHAPPITAALAKAASGALESVPIARVVNVARALDALRHADFLCVGLAAEASCTLAEALGEGPRPARLALVLGAEDQGLRRLVRERCDTLARIPIETPAELPGLDSLNVAVAAALAFYEARRR